jgi:SAM-dependent methyltransferase
VFSEIYENGAWGQTQAFDSGSGSRGAAGEPYISLVRALIAETRARRAVDIGCGDFRIASGFVDALETYVGIDVVPSLIERNRAEFGRPGVSFIALDAAASEVPDGDICFIRQVLQHLSNAEIAAILERCSKFPVVVVTEHWPSPQRQRRPNRDKPHGGDTRVDLGSWVDISAEPFACTPTSERLVVSYNDEVWAFPGETIRTVVWIPEK